MGKNGDFERRIREICKVLAQLDENQEKYLKITTELDNNYIAAVGNYRKNGRGSFAIRLKYGINTLLKIRNSTEFEQVRRVIDFLSEHKEYIEALDKVNGVESKTKRKTDEDMFI